MRHSKAPIVKAAVSFFAIVFAVSVCCFGVTAAVGSATGDATISFTPGSSSPGPGPGPGPGTTVPDTDRPATTVIIAGEDVPLDDTVSILDPDVPLADLPKTGGDTLITAILLMAGAGLVLAAKSDKPEQFQKQAAA